jgi:hypothetical protein
MKRTSGILLGTLVLSAASFAAPVLITSPGALGANDSVSWAQLGGDGTGLGATFNATSANSVAVTGALIAAGAQVSVVCPAAPSCSWITSGAGMNAGDSDIWTVSNGPLTLGFTAELGAGLWIQGDSGSFTASILAFNGLTQIGSGTLASDGAGDPVFIGELDSVQDITSIQVGISSCPSITCDPTDFAVDTLKLVEPAVARTPEPGTLWLLAAVLPLFVWRGIGKFRLSTVKAAVPAILLAGVAIATVSVVSAQDLTLPAGQPVMSDSNATAALRANAAITPAGSSISPLIAINPLPIGLYSIVGYDGNLYQGELVGRSPFQRGAKTTSVQVVVIPLIVKTPGAGGPYTSDPTAADNGCLGAGNTASSLSQGSPVLSTPVAPWTFNGVNVGGLTYTDAHMRGEFWQLISPSGNSFHLALPFIVAAPQTLDASGQSTVNANTLSYGGAHCGTNAGTTNNAGKLGFLNINYLDPILNTIIANLGLTHNQFPFFVIYRTVISGGSTQNTNNCCILGYHSNNNNATSIQDPGQTYGIALYDTGDVFNDVSDSSVMSHEMSEWANDPGGVNPTPVYSSGQTASCAQGGQNNFETGDALSGISNNLHIPMPNGKTYTLQELVYFSWFYNADHAGSLGAGVCAGQGSGCFSTNGTFNGPAQPCPTGGSYPN